MCYLSIYDVPIPANAKIYVNEFTKLVEFDMINPNTLGGLVFSDPDFNMIQMILGKQEFDSSPKLTRLSEDLKVYFFIAALVAFFLGASMFFMICKKIR